MTDALRSRLRELVAEALWKELGRYPQGNPNNSARVAIEALAPLLEVVEAADSLINEETPEKWMRLNGAIQDLDLPEEWYDEVGERDAALSNLHTGDKL